MMMIIFVILIIQRRRLYGGRRRSRLAGSDQGLGQRKPEARTAAFLERKSGIDYSTVSRVWAGKNPECQTALAILNVIATKEVGLAYLKKDFPHAAKFHEREFSTTPIFSDAEALKPVLDNVVSFLIMNLAFAQRASKDYISNTYGTMGLQIAELLIKSDRLQWEGNRLVPKGGEAFFTYESKDDLIKACQHIVSLSASDKGYPVSLIGSLTDEEMARFKMIIREFCGATKELIYSSQGGDNEVALATVLYSFFSRRGIEMKIFFGDSSSAVPRSFRWWKLRRYATSNI